MKATKYTMSITIEVLSLDTIPGLLSAGISDMHDEYVNGLLIATDGDSVEWSTTQKEVEF